MPTHAFLVVRYNRLKRMVLRDHMPILLRLKHG